MLDQFSHYYEVFFQKGTKNDADVSRNQTEKQ